MNIPITIPTNITDEDYNMILKVSYNGKDTYHKRNKINNSWMICDIDEYNLLIKKN